MIKLTIEEAPEYKQLEIHIKCLSMDKNVQGLISKIRSHEIVIYGKDEEGNIRKILVEDILYFETVERKNFCYLKEEVYQCEEKLYEIEEWLKDTSFIRISKQMILNIEHLVEVRVVGDRKYQAMLSNNESVIITRAYIQAFKERFGIV